MMYCIKESHQGNSHGPHVGRIKFLKIGKLLAQDGYFRVLCSCCFLARASTTIAAIMFSALGHG